MLNKFIKYFQFFNIFSYGKKNLSCAALSKCIHISITEIAAIPKARRRIKTTIY